MPSYISEYVKEIAVVCTVSGLICILGDKLEGGMSNFIKLISALVVTLCLSSPLVGLSDSNNISTLPMPTYPYDNENEDIYLENVAGWATENLTLTAVGMINNKWGFDENDLELSFISKIEDGRFKLEYCKITIKSLAALTKRNGITELIGDNFGCPCQVNENIIKRE